MTARARLWRGAEAAALAALVLALPAVAAEAPAPRQVIEQTVDQVLVILRDSSQTSAQRRERLEKIAEQRFDFRTMTKLVLARSWRRLSTRQKDDFVAEFTRYLANDYGSRLERYHQESVQVTGDEPQPRGDVVVKTRIVGGDNDGALVDYRLREDDGEWRIIDVVIEGVSLVANFRDQFREVMSRDGPEKVLEKLRAKNATGDTTSLDGSS
jgi:phospholipid transport system substrate-binding protein